MLCGTVWGYLCRVVSKPASQFVRLQGPGFLVKPNLPLILPLILTVIRPERYRTKAIPSPSFSNTTPFGRMFYN